MYPTIDLANAILESRRDQARPVRKSSPIGTPSTGNGRLVVLALFLAFSTLAACAQSSAAVPSPVTEDQAIEMAERALEGFNAGDYAVWSGDWSPEMKAAIDETAFLSFREQAHALLGDYVEITGVTGAAGSDAGTFRWTFDVQFERGPYRMWFGFKEGSPLVEGVTFEEPSS